MAQKHLLYSIATDSIEQGLDRKCLHDIKKRFLFLNEQRLKRVHSALNNSQQHFLSLLPLLFHVNHPMLPGYSGNTTPAGICDYTPAKEELTRGKKTARSFTYNQPSKNSNPIESIFLMGSIGTVAHNEVSDFDIWLCHNNKLNTREIQLLEEKCRKLSASAKELRLECHFFLMNGKNFEQGLNKNLSTEASGSAQHYLLLDEFYRTAIWLAGRLPLWWFIPSAREQNYQDYRHQLISKRYLGHKEYVDFGPVASIPAGEFLGAALWQLYKAIDSPHKSAFKLMLLEAYTSATSGYQTLSLNFKQNIYAGDFEIDELDPYIVAYRRIEEYLLKRNELQRLDLVRRCLYLKINIPLSKKNKTESTAWQRLLVEKLVVEWQWSKEKIIELDRHKSWKADIITKEHREIVNELNLSFKQLKTFHRRHQARSDIAPEEISILGHKLIANYEKREGKIDWINSGLSNDLSEEFLCFVENESDKELKDRAVDTDWRVYTCSPNQLQSPGNWEYACPLPIKQASLMESLVWCHCNGLLTAASHCSFFPFESNSQSKSPSSAQLKSTIRSLQQWLPLPLRAVGHNTFRKPAEIKQILIQVNLTKQPIEVESDSPYQTSELEDALGFGDLKDNLVKTIDLVTLNSWNEVCCQHFNNSSKRFSGDNALVSCLRFCLQSLYSRIDPNQSPPLVKVNCSHPRFGNTIRHRLGQLVQDLFKTFATQENTGSTRYIFSLGKGFVACQVEKTRRFTQKISFEELKGLEELDLYLSRPRLRRGQIILDRYLTIDDDIRLIIKLSHQEGIKVVFVAKESKLFITILDEKNSLLRQELGCRKESILDTLQALHFFLRKSIVRQRRLGGKFDADFDVYPISFYRLQRDKSDNAFLERCTIRSDLPHRNCREVSAKIVALPNGDEKISLSCAGQALFLNDSNPEFRKITSGSRADPIEKSDESRLSFVTSLDLDNYFIPGLEASRWQTSHYLRLKFDIEARLTG